MKDQIDSLPDAQLAGVKVGSRIFFAEEKAPYRVRARGERFLVCTKPFNLRKTVIYTVIDLVENVRGTENLIFGMGAESDQDCEEMLARLEGRDKCTPEEMAAYGAAGVEPPEPMQTEVSRRNRIPLRIALIRAARAQKGQP